MRTTVASVALIALVCAACLAGQPPASSPVATEAASTFAPRSAWEPAPSAPPKAPVDMSLAPVSASAPTPSEKEALDLCGAYEYGIKTVAGMGFVTSLSDVPKYARLPPTAPELQGHGGAWLIQFAGERPDEMTRQSWIDPTCLVIGGTPHVYATGPTRDLKTGKIVRGYYDVDVQPTLSLPPLTN
jgi:hypothetical protein